MKKKKIYDCLERYGLDRILEDNQITLLDCLDILEELGFICLEMYEDEELPDSEPYDKG